VPNPPQGFTFTTQPCTVGNSTGTQSLPTAINITVQNADTTCLATFRNGFLLTPPDGSCRVTPTPPPAPVASFTSQVVNAATHTMQFVDTSTGGPTSWAWTFFGGTPGTSTVQDPPSVTFPSAGTFNVRLTVTAPGGTSTVTMAVTVP